MPEAFKTRAKVFSWRAPAKISAHLRSQHRIQQRIRKHRHGTKIRIADFWREIGQQPLSAENLWQVIEFWIHGRSCLDDRLPEPMGNPASQVLFKNSEIVAPVTSKHFIRPIPGKRNCYVLTGHSSQVKHRYCRGIRKRFVKTLSERLESFID